MVIKTVYHFVDSNLHVLTQELKYPQKSGVNRKIGGVFEVVLPGRRLTENEGGVLKVILSGRGANDLPCEGKGLPEGPGVGVNYTD